jgi:hypothetical protein
VRAHLGRSDVGGLSAARVAGHAGAVARATVETMACLCGRAELRLLQAAIGEPAHVVERILAPALGVGRRVLEPGAHPAVRFRHDRIREAILDRLDQERERLTRATAFPAVSPPHARASSGWASRTARRGRALST